MKWAAILSALIVIQCTQTESSDEDLMFAQKNFATAENEFVGISGTLTGDGIAYKNNTYVIGCYREKAECAITSIEQIGSKQIGRLDYPRFVPIKRWDNYEVVASDDPGIFGCFRETIMITRRTESALWVREPTNITRPLCRDIETQMRRWTIEDSLGWTRLQATLRKK